MRAVFRSLVSNWFQGSDAAPTVWLAGDGFGVEGSMCGAALPPAGTEWIFVAFRTEGSELGVNLCSPHAAASSVDGQAMFADAVATFGQGQTVNAEPSPPPSAPSTPESSDPIEHRVVPGPSCRTRGCGARADRRASR